MAPTGYQSSGLPLALQHGEVPLALQQVEVEGWGHTLNVQRGGAVGRGGEVGVRHVDVRRQGVVGVCC